MYKNIRVCVYMYVYVYIYIYVYIHIYIYTHTHTQQGITGRTYEEFNIPSGIFKTKSTELFNGLNCVDCIHMTQGKITEGLL
jgi:hypothetical protein